MAELQNLEILTNVPPGWAGRPGPYWAVMEALHSLEISEAGIKSTECGDELGLSSRVQVQETTGHEVLDIQINIDK